MVNDAWRVPRETLGVQRIAVCFIGLLLASIFVASLVVALVAFGQIDDVRVVSVCNAGQNSALQLPGCPTGGTAVPGVALVFGDQWLKNVAFLRRLGNLAGVNVTKSGVSRLRFDLFLQSLTPQLIVGVGPAPNRPVTLNTNITANLICNAGNNSGQELPLCPQFAVNDGAPLFYGSTFFDTVVFARRIRSVSSVLTVSTDSPTGSSLLLNFYANNITLGEEFCNTGDNSGLDLPDCPLVGNNTGVTLVFGDTAATVTRVKRLAAGQGRINITTSAFNSPTVNFDFDQEVLCTVNCSENRIVLVENSPAGFGIVQGFGHTFSGSNAGAAILAGENSTLSGAPRSVVAACAECFVSCTHCGAVGGSAIVISINSDFSLVLNGASQLIDESTYALTAAGQSSSIEDSLHASILGGAMHFISDGDKSSIAGGQDISMGPNSFQSSALAGNSLTITGGTIAGVSYAQNLHTFGSLVVFGFQEWFQTTAIRFTNPTTYSYIAVGDAFPVVPWNLRPDMPDGIIYFLKSTTNVDINITAIDGASICPRGSPCTVNGNQVMTQQYGGGLYVYDAVGNRYLQIMN